MERDFRIHKRENWKHTLSNRQLREPAVNVSIPLVISLPWRCRGAEWNFSEKKEKFMVSKGFELKTWPSLTGSKVVLMSYQRNVIVETKDVAEEINEQFIVWILTILVITAKHEKIVLGELLETSCWWMWCEQLWSPSGCFLCEAETLLSKVNDLLLRGPQALIEWENKSKATPPSLL